MVPVAISTVILHIYGNLYVENVMLGGGRKFWKYIFEKFKNTHFHSHRKVFLIMIGDNCHKIALHWNLSIIHLTVKP